MTHKIEAWASTMIFHDSSHVQTIGFYPILAKIRTPNPTLIPLVQVEGLLQAQHGMVQPPALSLYTWCIKNIGKMNIIVPCIFYHYI
jgi:hypothetical protein